MPQILSPSHSGLIGPHFLNPIVSNSSAGAGPQRSGQVLSHQFGVQSQVENVVEAPNEPSNVARNEPPSIVGGMQGGNNFLNSQSFNGPVSN